MNSADIRVCFVGDSIVNGTRDKRCLGWTGRVCASAIEAGFLITYYNLGVRRNTSADIAARWVGECQARLPEECDCRVVFAFGANDTVIENGRRRVEREATLYHAAQILSEAKQRYSCLWIGPAPIADERHIERMGELCQAFQVLAVELGVPYLPVLEPLLRSRIWMEEIAGGDGAHPQNQGYSELARLVEGWDAWWFSGGLQR